MQYFRLLQVEPAKYAVDFGQPRPCAVEFDIERALEDALLLGKRVIAEELLGTCDGGDLLDYPFTIPLVHLVSERLRHHFERLAPQSIQFVDAKLSGPGSHHGRGYSIANVLETIDCVDRVASRRAIYSKENFPTWEKYPSKLGEIRSFEGLVLSRQKIGDHAIFRIAGWPMEVIVTSELVMAVAAEQLSGLRFDEIDAV